MIGEAEHPRIARLGHLHEVARLLIDGHRLTAHAIGAKDQPFAVSGPLMMSLVDLGITLWLACQERERHAGDRIDDGFLFGREAGADLGDSRQGEQQSGKRDERKTGPGFHMGEEPAGFTDNGTGRQGKDARRAQTVSSARR